MDREGTWVAHDKREPPTHEELDAALTYNAKLVINKKHVGKPPAICDYDFNVFVALVKSEAWKRMKTFRHGGRYTLREYSYIKCFFALRNIQERSVRHNKRAADAGVEDIPLMDYIESVIA